MPEQTVEDPLEIHLLVVRAQLGDEQAFNKLYELFSNRTFRYLEGLIGEDAADIHQELWLSVYRSIRHVGNPNAFRTWLYRATRHRAIDFLRAAKRKQELIEEVSIDDLDVSDEEMGGTDIQRVDIGKALVSMPAAQREVLLLRYRDDMSYAEMALVIGCPMGTVRTRLHHAKKRMHELLKREKHNEHFSV